MLSPGARNNFTLFDSICKPYTYRAHYIENVIERPNHQFDVWVRVLLKPIDEQAYVLTFQDQDGSFFLTGIGDPPPNWFGEQKEHAAEVVRQFVYGMKAGREDVVSHLVTSDMQKDFISDRCWKLQFQKFNYEIGSMNYVNLTSYEGLKIRVQPSGPGAFLVEQIKGEYKVVTAFAGIEHAYVASNDDCVAGRDTDKMKPVEDPNLEARTLERFHLSQEIKNEQ